MFHLFAAVIGVLRLTRTCPRCKRDQIISQSENNVAVKCKFCGAAIPPKEKVS